MTEENKTAEEMVASKEVVKEKKVRAARDTTSPFKVWAVENPFDGSIETKRFRASEAPVGAVFCKIVLEHANKVALEKMHEDGSCLVTWSTKQSRLLAVAKAVETGRQKFFDPSDVRVNLNVDFLRDEEVAEKQPRVRKERAPRVLKEGTTSKPRPAAFKGLLPEEENVELKFESYEEDGSTSVEVRSFSSKKQALVHARSLGLSAEEAEGAVAKVDGEWTVVQS